MPPTPTKYAFIGTVAWLPYAYHTAKHSLTDLKTFFIILTGFVQLNHGGTVIANTDLRLSTTLTISSKSQQYENKLLNTSVTLIDLKRMIVVRPPNGKGS
ncbi:unnamed protein product [Clavelina lepadiformis]|uniref:Uncharacterized protein n=1 Tax=Clavelina lepadiformis TaxID=159417 RepID=A0ABP0GSW3_CLALP